MDAALEPGAREAVRRRAGGGLRHRGVDQQRARGDGRRAGALRDGPDARSGRHPRRDARAQARSRRLARDRRALRRPPTDAVVVGDSWVDGVAATAAGVPFVAYRPNEADLTRWKLEPVGAPGRSRRAARRGSGSARTGDADGRRPQRPHGAVRAAGQCGGPRADRAAGRSHAAAHAGRGRRPGPPAGARASVLRAAIESGELHSMILWGPPGSGKTTLASLMAHVAGARFVAFSAVLSGVKEIREVVAEAESERTRRRPPHHPVRRRDPPLQPRPAGRLPAPRREGHHRPDRRHHREPLVRGELGAALALPRLRAARRSRRTTCSRSCAARWPIASAAWPGPAPEVSDDALRSIARLANGDARSALNVLELAVQLAPAGGRTPRRHRGGHPGGGAAADAALRQVGRGALQPDLRAPQVAARLAIPTPRSTG